MVNNLQYESFSSWIQKYLSPHRTCSLIEWLFSYSVILCLWADLFHKAIFFVSEQTYCARVICNFEWVTVALRSAFLNIHQSNVLRAVCILQSWLSCETTASLHRYCVHRATMHWSVYTFGKLTRIFYMLLWKLYQNKSEQRKLALEKKIIPPVLPGLKPTIFWLQSKHISGWRER